MKNIAIIGAGQLGSRHLQALAQVNADVILHIVDPSEQSLEVSKQRDVITCIFKEKLDKFSLA